MVTLRNLFKVLLVGVLLMAGLSFEPVETLRESTEAVVKGLNPFASAFSPTVEAALEGGVGFDSSLRLDGDGDYVAIAHDAALNPTGAFTLEAWVRRAQSDRCETIISKDAASAYWLGFCNETLRFYSGGTGTAEDGNTPIPADLWTHIAVVFQGSGRQYYINGDLDYTGNAELAPTTNELPVYIGADSDDGSFSFDGDIAAVRLWDVPRTQDEIRRTMHVALDEPLPGLVANWHFSNDYIDNIGDFDGTPQGNASLTGAEPPAQPAIVPVDSNFNQLAQTRYGAGTAYLPHLEQAFLIGGLRADVVSNQVDVLDVSTGETSNFATLPAARSWPAAAYAPSNDTIYLFGGSSTGLSNSPQDTIYAIDPNTGATREVATTLPMPLSLAVAVYHQELDKIYIFGGKTTTGSVTDITLFDPATETIAGPLSFELPATTLSPAATYSTINQNIYAFGGTGNTSIYEITVEADGVTGSVSQLTTELPVASFGLGAVEDKVTNLIYLLGGFGQVSLLAFDPLTTELWQMPIKLPEQRLYPSVVYSQRSRQALLIGGETEFFVDKADIWRVPLGNGPAVALGRWDFPQAVGDEVAAIDGDEQKVFVGTAGDSLWLYDESGARSQYTMPGSGTVRDVRYHALTDDGWVGSSDAGAMHIPNEGALDLLSGGELGTNLVVAVDVQPNVTDTSDFVPAFLGTDIGLKWDRQFVAGSYEWQTNFAGQFINAVKHRAEGDLWLVANGNLKRMTYDAAGNATETNFGTVCDAAFSGSDMAFGPNGDWWLTSAATGEFDTRGICRIAAAATPGVGNFLNSTLGEKATAVDVDEDGRIWISIDSGIGESGGLVAYEVTGASVDVVRTSEWNWLDAPVGSKTQVTFGVGVKPWDSGFTAVGAADERVWAGKEDGHLVTLAQRWQQLDESNDLDEKVIENIWTVRGRAFLATDNSLHILMPDGKRWENHNDLQVHAVLGDNQGNIWLGTESDVRLYTADGWDMFSTTVGTPPVAPIYALAEDQEGRIWIGGAGGLTLFDRDRFVLTFSTANSELPSDMVQTLLVDRDNRLWVGTDAGLARFDDRGWALFTTSEGLPDDAIHDLAQPDSGEIAISTAGGLTFYDEGSFSSETLPIADANLPLTVDELGRLWAGSAVRTADGWQGYYATNSGLRSSTISDNAADSAVSVWFSHAPETGVSLRGAYLPPLANVVPTISSINPTQGKAGDIITISGSGFGSNLADIEVIIGGAEAELVDVSETTLTVRLTANNTSGDVSVVVGGRRTTLSETFALPTLFRSPIAGSPPFCAEPVISSFTPTGGNDGVKIEITGTNFDRGADISLGGTVRTPIWRSPTRLEIFVSPEDGTGAIHVTNRCGLAGSSSEEFRRIALSIEKVVLNQGIQSTGLVADRSTMIQHYLSHSYARRDTDVIQLDTIEVTFIEGETESTTRIDYIGDVPTTDGAPVEALLRDIGNSVNMSATPEIEGNLDPDSRVAVHSVLRNNGQVVAQQDETGAWFRPNFVMHVLLVPFMQEGYTETQLREMQQDVNNQLDNLRGRLMPTGELEFHWSGIVATREEANSLDLGDTLALYEGSHDMDRARRRWNEHFEPDVLIAFGVVHQNLLAPGSIPGKAFWPDVSQMLNVLLLDWVDLLCDVGDTIVNILTLGQIGGDGCQLEIPIYVGWAQGNSNRVSSLFGHEIGHIMGLVGGFSPNGDFTDNYSHSVNDELDGGECLDSGVTFNWEKSLYRQPGVTEPVVNPLTGAQFPPLDEQNQNAKRGKAIMSYACNRQDDNSFFEPVDVPYIFLEFAASSTRHFIHDITPGGGLAREASPRTASHSKQHLLGGERLYVSGEINQANNTAQMRRVELLGAENALDASYGTGYWLVQLDNSDNELARTGIFPLFATAEDDNNDVGFFAATLLRQEGMTRLELRHDDTVLDTFSVGSATPTVSISSPAGGSYDTGTIPVTWTATDADGDTVEIVIEYSADGGSSWMPIAFSSGSGTEEIPLAQLAGSTEAQVRVIASDGLNSSSALSDAFTVAEQPPRPYISNPLEGSTFMEGESIMLSGKAEDNQDGLVADANLNWHSDRDGDLGTGSELSVILSVGPHILTLDAENSAGLQASTSVNISIMGDYDYDGLTDNEELDENLNPLTENDAHSDEDGDNLPLVMELKRGLKPDEADSDGDGRNDDQEVAEGTNPAVADSPLPPDELAAYPAELTFEADLSLDTPLPQQALQLVSQDATTWTLAADVEWLATNKLTGSTPEGVTVLVDAYLLDEGTHTAHLTVTSPLNTVIVPVNVTISNSDGYFDFDGDGINIGDVQTVAAHIPSNDSDAAFNHRHDIDRDTDIDVTDGELIAEQWTTLRDCCSTDYPISASQLSVSAPAAVKVGQSFTVDILIDDPQSLGGFEFELSFDPALLEVENVSLGELLSSTGRSSNALGPLTDNTNGLVTFGGYSYGEQAGITNNGILAQITFRALAGGNSALNIQEQLLADVNGTPSLATTENTTLTIKGEDEDFLLYLPTITR